MTVALPLFELQGDKGDEERVLMNLIMAASFQGTLERTETKDEIRFKGKVECDIPGEGETKALIKKRAGEGLIR